MVINVIGLLTAPLVLIYDGDKMVTVSSGLVQMLSSEKNYNNAIHKNVH